MRLLGVDREDLGLVPIAEARAMAEDEEVDVVLITADADPPVARLISFSKYKFEMERAAKQRQKASKRCDAAWLVAPVTRVGCKQTKGRARCSAAPRSAAGQSAVGQQPRAQ